MKSITNAQRELNTLKNDVIDLFEHYETLPKEVQNLILTITDEFDYEDCKQMVLYLNELGYTCEFGLDAQLFNLSVFS